MSTEPKNLKGETSAPIADTCKTLACMPFPDNANPNVWYPIALWQPAKGTFYYPGPVLIYRRPGQVLGEEDWTALMDWGGDTTWLIFSHLPVNKIEADPEQYGMGAKSWECNVKIAKTCFDTAESMGATPAEKWHLVRKEIDKWFVTLIRNMDINHAPMKPTLLPLLHSDDKSTRELYRLENQFIDMITERCCAHYMADIKYWM